MNINNAIKARDHFRKMPEKDFDFSMWEHCPPEHVREWVEASEGVPQEAKVWPVQKLFAWYGQVPCGTTACFAGELHLEFADTYGERAMDPPDFATAFLGMDPGLSSCVFTVVGVIMANCVVKTGSDVKPKDVANYIDRCIKAGGWIYGAPESRAAKHKYGV